MSRRGYVQVAGACLWLCGCVSVQAPERIEIGQRPPDPVDPDRLPATTTHDECRVELERAYQNVLYLEKELSRAQRKAAEYKRERDQARERLEKYEDD